jgi:hypothetical protein
MPIRDVIFILTHSINLDKIQVQTIQVETLNPCKSEFR